MFLLTLQSLHFSDIIATAFLHILQRVFALSAPGFYYNHDSNTSSPKRWIISDLIWDRMLLHPPKAPLSIVVTLLGIMMLTSDPHPQKAPFSIQVTLFGILMLVRQEQWQKASFPIYVTLSGILMLVSDLHHEKAKFPIFVTLFGILMLLSDIHLSLIHI